MENSKYNGGSAFPLIPPVDETGRTAVGYPYAEPGMSLRDYFAGQVIGHIITDASLTKVIPAKAKSSSEALALHLSGIAYALADAMIAERGK